MCQGRVNRLLPGALPLTKRHLPRLHPCRINQAAQVGLPPLPVGILLDSVPSSSQERWGMEPLLGASAR